MRRRRGKLYFDELLIQLAVAQLVRRLRAYNAFRQIGVVLFARFYDNIENFILGELARLVLDHRHLLLFYEVHGGLRQITYHGFHVAPDVTDLGKLGRLYLDKRRAHDFREPARDFGLTYARRSFHDNVLGRYFLAHGLGQHAPAIAVAERDCHGTLGFGLTDDIPVELGDDLLGGEVHYATSTTIFELVNMQISDAMRMDSRAICSAVISVLASSARPAASA